MVKQDSPSSLPLMRHVHEAVVQAVRFTCGEEYLSTMSNFPVQVNSNWRRAGDFKCACASAIYRRHTLKFRTNCASSDGSTTSESKAMKVLTKSLFGIERETVYLSQRELANAIVEYMLNNLEADDLIADIRVVNDLGLIVLTSKHHLDWHLFMDRHHCTECGNFFKGQRGIKTHWVVEHRGVYMAVQRRVLDLERQLVVYNPDMYVVRQWERTARSSTRARDGLADRGLEAAKTGDLLQLRHLVTTEGWNPIKVVDQHGSTALMWAAGGGHLEVCKYLVDECGVDVHNNNSSETASSGGTVMEHKSPNRTASSGGTVMEHKSPNRTASSGGTVMEHKSPNRTGVSTSSATKITNHSIAVSTSIGAGSRMEKFKSLADEDRAGAAVTFATSTTSHVKARVRHPLHWAARNGHVKVCEWLVFEMNISVDITTDDGTTPLHYAIWNENFPIIRWLVESAYCNVNLRNAFGCNAAQWCAVTGNVEIFSYLREHGLDVGIVNFNGRSALHKAAGKGRVAVAEWLLTSVSQGGAGLGYWQMLPDRQGNSPAVLATAAGHDALSDWLQQRFDELVLARRKEPQVQRRLRQMQRRSRSTSRKDSEAEEDDNGDEEEDEEDDNILSDDHYDEDEGNNIGGAPSSSIFRCEKGTTETTGQLSNCGRACTTPTPLCSSRR